jgi:hypothetical protein
MAQNNCSLNSVFTEIGIAMSLITAALWVVVGWLNVPGLIAGLVLLGVTAWRLAVIRDGIQAYAKCRGPSARCSLNTVGTLAAAGGVAGAILYFTLALGLSITALGFLFSWFLSWLSWAPAAAAEAAKNAGVAACVVAIATLGATIPALLSYQSCRDSETPAGTPGEQEPIPPIG